MKSQISQLFDDIAPHYDFLNHLLSLNIDKRWRKKSLKNAAIPLNAKVLDIACGTGDFAIDAYKAGAQQIIGIDVSAEMVALGNQKIIKKQLSDKVTLQVGDCANIDFASLSFDIVTVAFGVRNFENRPQSLKEIYRVLCDGGELVILEFSLPNAFPFKQLYRFYFKHILPFVGGLVSGNREAYTYLPDSVYAFPAPSDFMEELTAVGFENVQARALSFGIATAYYASKSINVDAI